MAKFTPYLLIAWVPLVLVAFPAFRRQRGVLVALLLGLLFLPEVGSPGAAENEIEPICIGPLHFTKDLAINYALLCAVLIYDFSLLASARPRWVDLPMIVWCLCPLASALTNEPPPDGSWAVRDGLSQMLHQTMAWGVPYLIGRLYFTDRRSLRDLALGVVLAAVVYVPLCLVEVRLSPQIHNAVYGFSQHSFIQTIRFGGYRPMVFFNHGLTLAFWMVSALLLAAWLACARGRVRTSFLGWAVLVLLPTVVLMKSLGALVLGMAGCGVLCLVWIWPSRLWLLLLVAVAPLYVAVRTSETWAGEELVQLARESVGEDRAQSLAFRLQNEDRLISRALEQPLFGWGGWGRARVFDESGKDTTVTDGLWVIALGERGLVGLVALGIVLLLPALLFAFRFPPRTWSQGIVAPASTCAVLLVLWSIDSLPNAGFNHVYLLMAGALTGLDPRQFREAREPAPTAKARQQAGTVSGPTQCIGLV